MIKLVPKISDDVARQFIRFAVHQEPEEHFGGYLSSRPGEWHFRADMMVGAKQFHVEWMQPKQDTEPAPDPRRFYPALASLLKNAEEIGA